MGSGGVVGMVVIDEIHKIVCVFVVGGVWGWGGGGDW